MKYQTDPFRIPTRTKRTTCDPYSQTHFRLKTKPHAATDTAAPAIPRTSMSRQRSNQNSLDTIAFKRIINTFV